MIDKIKYDIIIIKENNFFFKKKNIIFIIFPTYNINNIKYFFIILIFYNQKTYAIFIISLQNKWIFTFFFFLKKKKGHTECKMVHGTILPCNWRVTHVNFHLRFFVFYFLQITFIYIKFSVIILISILF